MEVTKQVWRKFKEGGGSGGDEKAATREGIDGVGKAWT